MISLDWEPTHSPETELNCRRLGVETACVAQSFRRLAHDLGSADADTVREAVLAFLYVFQAGPYLDVEVDDSTCTEWLLSAYDRCTVETGRTYQAHSGRVLGDNGFIDRTHPSSQLKPVNDLRVDVPDCMIPACQSHCH